MLGSVSLRLPDLPETSDLDNIHIFLSNGFANLDRAIGLRVSSEWDQSVVKRPDVSLSENLVTLHLHSGKPSLQNIQTESGAAERWYGYTCGPQALPALYASCCR